MNSSTSTERETMIGGAPITVGSSRLEIEDVFRVAAGAPVALSEDPEVQQAVADAAQFITDAVERSAPIYGVTTGFGGMSNVVIPKEQAIDLQNNLPVGHKTGAGRRLRAADVRAGMLIRINSLMRGASGARLELIQRMVDALNANLTPHVFQLGSIGASGDLVPLAYVAGAVTGLDSSFMVDLNGEPMSSTCALERLGLERMTLGPKEGLAMMNGTSMMTGIASNVLRDTMGLTAVTLGLHGLYTEALNGSNQSFHAFIHANKPHTGQVWVAQQMLDLIEGSALVRDELDGRHDHRPHRLIQDRYSVRCLPQFLGPVIEGLWQAYGQIETEVNSVTDNPLIDLKNGATYHGGNFLGQYVGVAMDHVRYYVGLMAKHLDAQIALLVAPEFNHGLPASLVGNQRRVVNVGLKALQITANSIMPMLTYYGQSLADRFATHAEQFNQNINSLGFGSANLARESIDTFQQYLAVALIFAVQAVELRCQAENQTYVVRPYLAPRTRRLYEAVYAVLGRPLDEDRPLVWDDSDQRLDAFIARLAADLVEGHHVGDAVRWLERDLVSGAA